MKVLGKPQNIPTGSGKYKPDKPPEKGGGRWNKTFGYYDEGTVDEAGISDASAEEGMSEDKKAIDFGIFWIQGQKSFCYRLQIFIYYQAGLGRCQYVWYFIYLVYLDPS